MVKNLIVADSSCDLLENYIDDNDIKLNIVPFNILFEDQEFIDNKDIDLDALLDKMESTKTAGKTSCPSPANYLEFFEKGENVICITISSKLSGSYNSACVAKEMCKNKNIIVIDSKGEGATLVFIIDKAKELLESGMEFSKIEEELIKFRDEIKLYFVLDNFSNLSKNGRVNKVVYRLAMLLKIKPVACEKDGEIAVQEKVRTFKAAIKKLIKIIEDEAVNLKNKICYISHVRNLETAEEIKSRLLELNIFKKIEIRESRGLSAFYAEKGGIVVGIA